MRPLVPTHQHRLRAADPDQLSGIMFSEDLFGRAFTSITRRFRDHLVGYLRNAPRRPSDLGMARKTRPALDAVGFAVLLLAYVTDS